MKPTPGALRAAKTIQDALTERAGRQVTLDLSETTVQNVAELIDRETNAEDLLLALAGASRRLEAMDGHEGAQEARNALIRTLGDGRAAKVMRDEMLAYSDTEA